MFIKAALIAIIFLFFSTVAVAVERVIVVGLFKDQAVVIVDKKQYRLQVGERTPEGVLLKQASSHSALLEVNGKVQQYNLSHTIGYKIEPKQELEVLITPDESGMYRISGKINLQVVTFIVDTGASHVAMNAKTADELDIDYRTQGIPTKVETASGLVKAYGVRLKLVEIGEIKVRNVLALVIEGENPRHVLLGMSFLDAMEIRNQGKILLLRQKW